MVMGDGIRASESNSIQFLIIVTKIPEYEYRTGTILFLNRVLICTSVRHDHDSYSMTSFCMSMYEYYP
jgi:hypothetical protein